MISRIRGRLIEKQAPVLLLEVGGLTYELQAPMPTFYQLPELGQEVILYTQFIVREDGHYLYGFAQITERSLFRQLLKITGIGPKVALAILSNIEVHQFIQYVSQQDATRLQRLPGIGRKTAERLIIEMRDHLADILPKASGHTSAGLNVCQTAQDAISALIALGYKPQIAHRAVDQVQTTALSVEQIIRLALQQLA